MLFVFRSTIYIHLQGLMLLTDAYLAFLEQVINIILKYFLNAYTPLLCLYIFLYFFIWLVFRKNVVPETDDDDEFDDRPSITGPRAGVDDGLLPNDENGVVSNQHPVKPPSRRPSFAFPGYHDPGFVNINGVNTPIPDINAYQHKKTLAQGMMDLALLSANANQLRYVLESYQRHPYYYPSLVFISLSIIFQVSLTTLETTFRN